jgi:hypothetical protein
MGTPRRERQTNAGAKGDSDRDAGATTECDAESRARTGPDTNPGCLIPSAVLGLVLL